MDPPRFTAWYPGSVAAEAEVNVCLVLLDGEPAVTAEFFLVGPRGHGVEVGTLKRWLGAPFGVISSHLPDNTFLRHKRGYFLPQELC